MNGECGNGAATPHPVATYPAFTFQSCQQALEAESNAYAHVNLLADFGTDQVNRDLIQTLHAAVAYHRLYCEPR
jgi:hypothetical protein